MRAHGWRNRTRGPRFSSEASPPTRSETRSRPGVDAKPVIVIIAGLRAVGGRCNHYGADPEDDVFDGGLIHCPWHHASFDGATGEAAGCTRPLDSIPTHLPTERGRRVHMTGPGGSASQGVVANQPFSKPPRRSPLMRYGHRFIKCQMDSDR